MTETTPRFALPLLAAGQAQKDVWHNEALTLLDCIVQPVVQAVAPPTVPVSPVAGQCWIVGPSPSGDWAGRPNQIACWTANGWRFVAPVAGMTCLLASDFVPVRFNGTGWIIGDVAALRLLVNGVQLVGARQPAIAAPSGGTTIDAESRIALASILAALRTHGLIST